MILQRLAFPAGTGACGAGETTTERRIGGNVRARRLVGALGVAAVVAATAAGTGSAADVAVTNANDSGPGSFRAAIAAASGNASIGRVVFSGVGTVELAATVEYTGTQALEIVGNGAVLDGSRLGSDAAAFASQTTGNLVIRTLTVRDAPGEGVAYQVPAGSSGARAVTFDRVQILGNGGHGVLVNDQDFPEIVDPDNGIPRHPAGSAASLLVSVTKSTIADNGHVAGDRDGIRVNEGAAGDLTFTLVDTRVEGNGGDGVELDERGPGDAAFTVSGSRLTGNGPFDPDDLDDGMDVDESLEGDVIGTVIRTVASDNFEEGLDFNENDAGNMDVTLSQLEANGNREEGIDLEEDDDFAGGGNLVVAASQITADRNGVDGGDGGLKIREKGVGDLRVALSRITAGGNLNMPPGSTCARRRKGRSSSRSGRRRPTGTPGRRAVPRVRGGEPDGQRLEARRHRERWRRPSGTRAERGERDADGHSGDPHGNAGGDLILDGVTQAP